MGRAPLRAGDGLYVPPSWPHGVETRGEARGGEWSAAINFFYDVPVSHP